MKLFVKRVLVRMCVYFTIAMALWLCAGLVFVGPVEGIVLSISILVACTLTALLQGLWFSDLVMKRPAYPMRILGFGVTLFVALAACAWFGGWLPQDNVGAWIAFAAIFLALLALFSALFTAMYRKMSVQYDDALRRYQEKGRTEVPR